MNENGISVNPELSKCFYKALIMLELLGKIRDEPVEEGNFFSDIDPTTENIVCARRREFLKGLAYLYDYEEPRHTTTAIALEEISTAYIYSFASNNFPLRNCPRSEDKAKEFIESILNRLKNVKQENSASVENDILESALALCSEQIEINMNTMFRQVDSVLSDLPRTNSIGGIITLRNHPPCRNHLTFYR